MPFTCEIRSEGFSQSGNLKMHNRLDSKEKPFSCEICSKRFSLRGHLKTHYCAR